jgi:xylan 1,4-beta-xylosidase
MNFMAKSVPTIVTVLLAVSIHAQTTETNSIRAITADWQSVKGSKSELFHECIGAGRAAEGLRADWQRQLKMCQDEIGFNYIRFHGLLSDDMGVYTEPRGRPEYNWQYIDQLYDALLALHIRPFVELSFMPSALASGSKTIFWWKANVTPPKDYLKWEMLIRGLTRHLTDRYGTNEVKQWYFEVWNEADYPGFWGPRNPTNAMNEYLEFYAQTARQVKFVNPDYRVGGPAGSQTVWIQPLIEYCSGNNLPLDFISFHTYGLGNGASGLDEFGNQFLYLGSNLRAPADTMARGRSLVDASQRAGLPVYITEWSASYSPRDPIHDSYFSAPYILEQFKHAEHGIAAMSYWTFTDTFEENGPPTRPFHGGFGLLNFEGIKKPAYFAYQFMNQLGSTELQNSDDASWVCRDDKGGVEILLWDLTRLADAKVANQNVFYKLQPAKPRGSVNVKLAHVPPGNYRLALRQTGFEKNDAYSAYLEMGAPAQLTRAQEKILRESSTGGPEFERDIKIGADGLLDETLPLRENDVLLLTLTPQ